MSAHQSLTYDAFVELASAGHSDHDLCVVLADGATTARTGFAGQRARCSTP
ncbi:hypothetical protein ACFW5I_02480 [Streptomyces sp. NPDC058818]|uniref:hypothetical protein n=1 Tax=Streptomyces sp. NPDC058818 TaxID=3346640 RepID=UPI003686EF67